MNTTLYVAKSSAVDVRGNPELIYPSISAAVRAANEGDVIEIHPGVYKEAVVLDKKRLTLRASEERGVVITLPDARLLDPDAWERISSSKNVYEQALPDDFASEYIRRHEDGAVDYDIHSINLYVNDYCLEFVQVCGTGLHTNFGTGERTYSEIEKGSLDDSDQRRWTVTSEGKVQVNLGEQRPSFSRITVNNGCHSCVSFEAGYCSLSGVNLQGGHIGFSFKAGYNMVEDCVVKHSYFGARQEGFLEATNNIIRRCSFLNCKEGIFISDNMGVHLIEENLFIGTGQPLFHERSPQSCINEPWGPGTATRYANTHYIVFRHNVIADSTWAGWWPDVNCYGNYYYGNVLTGISNRGLYNEYPVNDTRIYYNAITDCDDGIIQRFSWRTMNLYNYIEGCRDSGISIWGPHIDNGYIYDNVFMKNILKNNRVAFIYSDNRGMSGNLPVSWPGDGELSMTALTRMRSQVMDDNLYAIPENGEFALINGAGFNSPQQLNAVAGFDSRSEVMEDPALESFGLGMYTINIPFSRNSDKSVALVGNPVRDFLHCDLLPLAAEDAPYFWRQGTWDDQREGDHWKTAYGYAYEWPHNNRPVRRLMRTRPGFDPESAMRSYAAGETALPDGPGLYMEMISHIPEQIPAGGSGFWSASLPAVEGMPVRVSFCISAENVNPTDGGRGFVAAVKFTTLEGKVVDVSQLWNEQPANGMGWRGFDACVSVPDGAARLAVFIGMTPCEKDSVIRVGNLYIRCGNRTTKENYLLPDFVRAELVDLDKYYNHELNEDAGGPPSPCMIDDFTREHCYMNTVDLSGLDKGEFNFEGIPVRIDKAVTLRCHRRPPIVYDDGARGVRVGNKVRALAFFTAGDHMAGAQENFRFVVHYSGGGSAELVPVTDDTLMHYRQPFFIPGEVNMQPAVRYGFFKDLSCFIWENPDPGTDVDSFDFLTMDTGNAILISAAAMM